MSRPAICGRFRPVNKRMCGKRRENLITFKIVKLQAETFTIAHLVTAFISGYN